MGMDWNSNSIEFLDWIWIKLTDCAGPEPIRVGRAWTWTWRTNLIYILTLELNYDLYICESSSAQLHKISNDELKGSFVLFDLKISISAPNWFLISAKRILEGRKYIQTISHGVNIETPPAFTSDWAIRPLTFTSRSAIPLNANFPSFWPPPPSILQFSFKNEFSI